MTSARLTPGSRSNQLISTSLDSPETNSSMVIWLTPTMLLPAKRMPWNLTSQMFFRPSFLASQFIRKRESSSIGPKAGWLITMGFSLDSSLCLIFCHLRLMISKTGELSLIGL